MKKSTLIIFLLIFFAVMACKTKKTSTSVLLITGGHAYDTTEFFEFFNSLEEITLDTITQPEANKFLLTKQGQSYDAYVFYDMWKEIDEEEKQAYLDITEQGKGLLFLHHSLATSQNWPEFKKIVGGKYHLPEGKDSSMFSTYRHGLDLDIKVIDNQHPVTAEMSDFAIHDEAYGNLDLLETIQPLLTTEHPDCNPVVAWTNEYRNSRIVYLIFGHDKHAYEDEDFRKLIQNSINYITKN